MLGGSDIVTDAGVAGGRALGAAEQLQGLHLIDPHFGPENAGHRKVLEAFLDMLATMDPSSESTCLLGARRSRTKAHEGR